MIIKLTYLHISIFALISHSIYGFGVLLEPEYEGDVKRLHYFIEIDINSLYEKSHLIKPDASKKEHFLSLNHTIKVLKLHQKFLDTPKLLMTDFESNLLELIKHFHSENLMYKMATKDLRFGVSDVDALLDDFEKDRTNADDFFSIPGFKDLFSAVFKKEQILNGKISMRKRMPELIMEVFFHFPIDELPVPEFLKEQQIHDEF